MKVYKAQQLLSTICVVTTDHVKAASGAVHFTHASLVLLGLKLWKYCSCELHLMQPMIVFEVCLACHA